MRQPLDPTQIPMGPWAWDRPLPTGWQSWDDDDRRLFTERTGFTDWPDGYRPRERDALEEALTSGTGTKDSLAASLEEALNKPVPTQAEALALNGKALEDRLTAALNGGQTTADHIRNNLNIY